MNVHTPNRRSDEKVDRSRHLSWRRLLIGGLLLFLLPAVVLFGSSGRLDWPRGWTYVGLAFVFNLGSRVIILWKNPALVGERLQGVNKEDAESWDRVLMPLGILLGTIMLIMAGLDKRFAWSPPLPLWLPIAAFVLIALGYSLSTWATMVNTFFSSVARIQRERRHVVVTTGPYRYVRHPGYAGAVVTSLATPLLLGSLWALIPTVLMVCQLIIRTALEDRLLQDKLEGYRDYAMQVRYRLLPEVW